MRFQLTRYMSVLMSLLVVLMTAQAGAQGYVWCVGSDGHSALEPAEGDDCRITGEDDGKCCSPAGALDFASGEEESDSCIDIALSFDAASNRLNILQDLSIQPPLHTVEALQSTQPYVWAVTVCLYPQRPTWVQQALLSLSTIVLLN
jgi:hypothetical protein